MNYAVNSLRFIILFMLAWLHSGSEQINGSNALALEYRSNVDYSHTAGTSGKNVTMKSHSESRETPHLPRGKQRKQKVKPSSKAIGRPDGGWQIKNGNDSVFETFDGPTLHIVANHKSGVFLSTKLAMFICRNGASFHNVAHKGCPGVKPSMQGLHSGIKLAMAENPNDVFIHAIRHPVDMVLSGYYYHKQGKEKEWTGVKIEPGKRYLHIPADFPIRNVSYSKWLKTHPEEQGLEMELVRTLHARDGLGKMLKDMLFLQSSGAKVLNLCMSQAKMLMPAVERFVQPWVRPESVAATDGRDILGEGVERPDPDHHPAAIASAAALVQATQAGTIDDSMGTVIDLWSTPDLHTHYSDKAEEARLANIAAKLVAESLPLPLLATFPCPSEFYRLLSATDSFLYDLPVDLYSKALQLERPS